MWATQCSSRTLKLFRVASETIYVSVSGSYAHSIGSTAGRIGFGGRVIFVVVVLQHALAAKMTTVNRLALNTLDAFLFNFFTLRQSFVIAA